jgi:hypothetical protein
MIFCGDWESHGQYGSGPGRAVKGHGAAGGVGAIIADLDGSRAVGPFMRMSTAEAAACLAALDILHRYARTRLLSVRSDVRYSRMCGSARATYARTDTSARGHVTVPRRCSRAEPCPARAPPCPQRQEPAGHAAPALSVLHSTAAVSYGSRVAAVNGAEADAGTSYPAH